jgi:ABC-type antimicrobial peptide transport system permease subunit
MRQIDSGLAMHEVKTQAAHVDEAIRREITLARLGSSFAFLALVIACVGLYGTVTSNVARRTNEIGIRMALGAHGLSVVRGFLGRGLRLGAIGAGAGMIAALAVGRLVTSVLYGVSSTDVRSLVAALAVVLGGVVLATVVPAWRATRTNPLTALRHQ